MDAKWCLYAEGLEMGKREAASNKFLAKVIHNEKYFKLLPYIFMPRGIIVLHLVGLHNQEMFYLLERQSLGWLWR